jgi:hypothetical protein
MPRRLPISKNFEVIGRSLLTGLGKIANRAIASGAKSVVGDIDRAGAEIRFRASRAKQRIEEFLNVDDQGW